MKDFDAIELSEQMRSDGFHSSEILIVLKEGDVFVVLDGNRRLAAFRHAHTLGWIPNSRNTLPVTVAPSREEADKVIIVKHVGALKKNWTTPNQLNKLREIVSRSPGKTIKEIVEKYPSLGSEKAVTRSLLDLEIYNLLIKSDWLNSDDKGKVMKRGINMIHRFYTSKLGKKYFNLNDLSYPFEKNRLHGIINGRESQHIVRDYIVRRTSAQIKAPEIEDIFRFLFDKPNKPKKKIAQAEKRATDRKNLIPAGCRMVVKHGRVSDIYLELRDCIQVNEAPNAVAALFRIFMELSLDYYIEKNFLLNKKSAYASIKQKISLVTGYMEERGVAKTEDLKNVRRVGSEKNSYLGVEVFNEYMHSLKTNPEPSDLKTKWDNLEGFFEILWSDVS